MTILDTRADGGEGKAVGCDTGCDSVLEPGEHSTPRGPWNARQAEDAAEAAGWLVDGTVHICPDCEKEIGALLDALDGEVRS